MTEENSSGGNGAESLLEGLLETLEQNPEIAELAGKLVGTALPFPDSEDTPYEQSGDAGKKGRGDGSARASALLKALKPYMNDQRADSVERLLKLLPTADLIRTALHAFGELS